MVNPELITIIIIGLVATIAIIVPSGILLFIYQYKCVEIRQMRKYMALWAFMVAIDVAFITYFIHNGVNI